MADDANEDSWLYGTSNPDSTTNDDERTTNNTAANTVDISTKSENEALAAIIGGNLEPDGTVTDGQDAVEEETEMGEFEDLAHEMEEDEDVANDNTVADTTDVVKKEECQDGASEDDVDDDDSDDDINVVIGEMKAPSTYNIKQRSNLLAGVGSQDKGKSSSQGGKFSIEDFEGVGGINGVAAHEFSIDSLEEKPWRKPGADITDYFNYGFNEETWRAYCERQKRFRVVESGVGLASLTQNLNPSQDRQHAMEGGPQQGLLHPGVITQGVPAPISEHMQIPPPSLMPPPNSHQGPPPRFGIIPRGPRSINTTVSKENAIQVMTAECREYSRTGQMMSNFGGIGPVEDTYFHEPEPFDYGYEPTQEQSWGNENSNWVPTGIKELTPGPGLGPPPPQMTVPPQMSGPPPQIRPPHPQGTMAPNIPPSMPPNIPNIAMGPPPPIGLIMGASTGGPPPIRMPMGPPRMIAPNAPMDRIDEERDRDRRRREREWERERERERERDRDRDTSRSRRERSRSREKSRRRSKSREKEREKDRDKERDRERERDRDRGRDTERERERERNEKTEDIERPEEERERRRRERDRERERDRDRERSRRDRSRSREKSRRRSKSRDKERERSSKTATSSTSTSSSRSDKKKSHRKEDDE